MADIEHVPPPRSVAGEKKHEPDAASDESPTRIEEGGKGGLMMNEEEATARVKAYPDDATPIYVTWGHNDPTNPRNWPVRIANCCTLRLCLTPCVAEMEEMVDNMFCQLLELPNVSGVHNFRCHELC